MPRVFNWLCGKELMKRHEGLKFHSSTYSCYFLAVFFINLRYEILKNIDSMIKPATFGCIMQAYTTALELILQQNSQKVYM